MIKRIAVLTSGGDAPGMNAAIRAVVRTANYKGIEVYGVYDGFRGMYEGKIERLSRKSVSNKIRLGGTFLGTARLPEFVNKEIREVAIENLHEYGIDAVVAIGGDGTYRGALALHKMNIQCIAIPATIDNDIGGTDFTIGFDTALTTVIDAVDKLRDTSNSHRRCSIIEVMGRDCGAIAIWTGIAVGAEYVASREIGYNEAQIIEEIREASRTKRHAIVIISEHLTDVEKLAKTITDLTPFEARATVLGHVQRGGAPTPRDRVLAAMMGVRAIEELLAGNSGVAISEVANKITVVALAEALNTKTDQVLEKYEIFKVLG